MNEMDHLCKEAPVIALTANVHSGAREGYQSYGFADYLSKPVEGRQLEEAVKQYLPKNLIIEDVLTEHPNMPSANNKEEG